MGFDPESDQIFNDSSIMWGGMQQLALDKAMSQKWPQNSEQNMFDQQSPVTHIGQYGQITPPNDDSPFFPAMKQEEDITHSATMGPGQPQEAPPAASTRSKRGSSSRKPKDKKETQDQLQEKSKKTTRKARKGYKATTKEEEENDSDGEMKRERFLERNRVAASKCRQKKKHWTNGLEAHARELAAANAQLNAHALSLKEEVLYLKSECLKHTDCDCSRIREYLDRSIAGMNPSNSLNMMGSDPSAGYQGSRFADMGGYGDGTPETDETSTTDEAWPNALNAEDEGPVDTNGQSRADRGMQELLQGRPLPTSTS